MTSVSYHRFDIQIVVIEALILSTYNEQSGNGYSSLDMEYYTTTLIDGKSAIENASVDTKPTWAPGQFSHSDIDVACETWAPCVKSARIRKTLTNRDKTQTFL